MPITRTAVTGLAIAAFTLAGAGAASAQPSSSPAAPPSGSVTITLNPDQVSFLCDKRLPKVESRTTKLINRINGDANTKGSVAWLKAKAKTESDAGRTASAQLLNERADRRAGRIDELNKVKGWAADFRSKYCGGAK
jgi:hypothetical protein